MPHQDISDSYLTVDRRSGPRVTTDWRVVTTVMRGARRLASFPGRTYDISEGGVAIALPSDSLTLAGPDGRDMDPLWSQAAVVMAVFLPGSVRPVTCSGRIVRCGPNGTPETLILGVRFLNWVAQGDEALRYYLARGREVRVH